MTDIGGQTDIPVMNFIFKTTGTEKVGFLGVEIKRENW